LVAAAPLFTNATSLGGFIIYGITPTSLAFFLCTDLGILVLLILFIPGLGEAACPLGSEGKWLWWVALLFLMAALGKVMII